MAAAAAQENVDMEATIEAEVAGAWQRWQQQQHKKTWRQ